MVIVKGYYVPLACVQRKKAVASVAKRSTQVRPEAKRGSALRGVLVSSSGHNVMVRTRATRTAPQRTLANRVQRAGEQRLRGLRRLRGH